MTVNMYFLVMWNCISIYWILLNFQVELLFERDLPAASELLS